MAIQQLRPQLWAQLAPVFSTFNQFLDQFLKYDEIVAKQEAEENRRQAAITAQPRKVREVVREVRAVRVEPAAPGMPVQPVKPEPVPPSAA